MGGQLDGNFLPGSLPQVYFDSHIVYLLVVNKFLSLSFCSSALSLFNSCVTDVAIVTMSMPTDESIAIEILASVTFWPVKPNGQVKVKGKFFHTRYRALGPFYHCARR